MKTLYYTSVNPPAGPTVNGQVNVLASTLTAAITAALAAIPNSTFNTASALGDVTLDSRPQTGSFSLYGVGIRKTGVPDVQYRVLAADPVSAITAALADAGTGAVSFSSNFLGPVNLETT